MDLDDVNVLKAETAAHMAMNNLSWSEPPAPKRMPAPATSMGFVVVFQGQMAAADRSEFIDAMDELAFWHQARHLAADWYKVSKPG